jgi:hypothetical protein
MEFYAQGDAEKSAGIPVSVILVSHVFILY